MEDVEIVHIGGTRKTCQFCGFLSRGGWIQLRYPGGAGLFAFSLRHGKIECKRGESPQWQIASQDVLDGLRKRAREEGIKFSIETRRASKKGKPKSPATAAIQRQTAWCE